MTSTEEVLKELEVVGGLVSVGSEDTKKVVDHAKAYLDDAKYYKDKGKFAVSLTSVAYCEGLLDALRLLGAVKFEWPTKTKARRKRQS